MNLVGNPRCPETVKVTPDTPIDPDDLKARVSDLISDVIYMREQELDLRLNDIEARKEIEHQRIETGMLHIGVKTT